MDKRISKSFRRSTAHGFLQVNNPRATAG